MHSRKKVENPVCKDCGTSDNLKKDKYQTSGYRSICYSCDRKRQRIRINGYDTGSPREKPRVCIDCGESDITKLCPNKNSHTGVMRLCKSCGAKRMRKQRAKPHSKHNENHKRSRKNKRLIVINHYGHKCAICGERHYEFLAIDHVNNNGAEHKRQLGERSNDKIILEIIKNNFPPDYQILCHNCNSAKQYYKQNPIQIEKEQHELTEGYMGEGI